MLNTGGRGWVPRGSKIFFGPNYERASGTFKAMFYWQQINQTAFSDNPLPIWGASDSRKSTACKKNCIYPTSIAPNGKKW
jgi:hypothetical protein